MLSNQRMKPSKKPSRESELSTRPEVVTCSLEDVLYHLYVIQKVEAGLADADAGKLISHEQVAEELRRKWVKGAAGASSAGASSAWDSLEGIARSAWGSPHASSSAGRSREDPGRSQGLVSHRPGGHLQTRKPIRPQFGRFSSTDIASSIRSSARRSNLGRSSWSHGFRGLVAAQWLNRRTARRHMRSFDAAIAFVLACSLALGLGCATGELIHRPLTPVEIETINESPHVIVELIPTAGPSRRIDHVVSADAATIVVAPKDGPPYALRLDDVTGTITSSSIAITADGRNGLSMMLTMVLARRHRRDRAVR